MTSQPHVQILGASTRAAAWSVHRSGGTAAAYDLFADVDFPSGTEQTQLQQISTEIVHDFCFGEVSDSDSGSLLLTGPCENILGRNWQSCSEDSGSSCDRSYYLPAWVSQQRNIRLARSPFHIRELLGRRNYPALQVLQNAIVVDHLAYQWLLKPYESIAGIEIRFSNPATDRPHNTNYFQEYKEGISCSAQLISWYRADGVHQTEFLGLTRQFNNSAARPATPFLYAGNAFPLAQFAEIDDKACAQQVSEIGAYLAAELGLTGCWGFDFVWANEYPFLVEINPRYTNALELIEHGQQRALLAESAERLHIPGVWQPIPQRQRSLPVAIIKLIYYAPRALRIDHRNFWQKLIEACGGEYPYRHPWEVPIFSDLPKAGSSFSSGEPVCTIWGTGSSGAEAEQVLSNRRLKLEAAFNMLS